MNLNDQTIALIGRGYLDLLLGIEARKIRPASGGDIIQNRIGSEL